MNLHETTEHTENKFRIIDTRCWMRQKITVEEKDKQRMNHEEHEEIKNFKSHNPFSPPGRGIG